MECSRPCRSAPLIGYLKGLDGLPFMWYIKNIADVGSPDDLLFLFPDFKHTEINRFFQKPERKRGRNPEAASFSFPKSTCFRDSWISDALVRSRWIWQNILKGAVLSDRGDSEGKHLAQTRSGGNKCKRSNIY
jgi:hypothetical protein